MLPVKICFFLFLLSAFIFAGQPVLAQDNPPTAPPPQVAAPAATAPGQEQPAAPPEPASVKLRLGSGDLLYVTVYGVPELAQELRVGNDGDVSMALVGSVHIAGLTAEEAQAAMEKRLMDGGFLRNPHVSVLVKEYATQGASVMGEVVRPGVYPVLGARRLFDVVAAAGGLTPRAGKIVTITHRDHPHDPINVEMSNDPAKSAQSNVPVRPGDTVVVTKAGLVYVVGEVGRPSGLVMENNETMTVLQAIALAQGTTSMAALDRSKLIRKTPKGPVEIPIPLRKILAAKAPDVGLQPDDIVFVPGSPGKGFTRRGVEAIIAITTGLAVYRRP